MFRPITYKNTFFFTQFSILVLLFSCSDNDMKKQLIGKWQCVEWSVDGDASANKTDDVSFEFQNDGKYTYKNEGIDENGVYKIADKILYTTPQNQTEMGVKIKLLTSDSLIFDMNRGGMAEEMILVKK
jgi:hypothetical protein